jgi:uncharacterized protein (DUF3084 family)
MALQLGALRDALISAGVGKPEAVAAAEEMAGVDIRLTRLSTQMQLMIGVMLLLLASQAALWAGYGRLGSRIGDLQARTARIEQQNALIISQLAGITSPPR